MEPLSLYEWHQISFLLSDLKRLEKKIATEKLEQTRLYFLSVYEEKEKRLLSFAHADLQQILSGTGVIPNPNK